MKILLAFFLVLSGCASRKPYPDKDFCFLLYDLKKDQMVDEIGNDHCENRLPAASTFKLPLAVMAFDRGILKQEVSPIFDWDKTHYAIETWNEHQSPSSWMKNSVVWVSQEITPRLGQKVIEKYLAFFNYGNQDMSGGLKYAWLTPAPYINEPMQNSLKISAHEQLIFLKKLWKNELKASVYAQQMTRNLLIEDRSASGAILRGKSGSGFTDATYTKRVAWYLGHLQVKDQEYVIVSNFVDLSEQPIGSFGGTEDKEMVIEILSEKGLW